MSVEPVKADYGDFENCMAFINFPFKEKSYPLTLL